MMRLDKALVLLFSLFITLLPSVFPAAFASINEEETETATSGENDADISPKCAAVLLLTGASGVAATMGLASVPLLSAAGFTPVGVAAGSFAAWWQSTYPLVAAGSLFSYLQSIAMTGSVVTGSASLGAVLGSAAAVTKVREMCRTVDGIDENSFEGQLLQKILELVRATPNKEDLQKLAADFIERAKDGLEQAVDYARTIDYSQAKAEMEKAINFVKTANYSQAKAEMGKVIDYAQEEVEKLIEYAQTVDYSQAKAQVEKVVDAAWEAFGQVRSTVWQQYWGEEGEGQEGASSTE